jgi:hypothetical protein
MVTIGGCGSILRALGVSQILVFVATPTAHSKAADDRQEKLADANESWQREVLLQLKTQEDFDWARGTRGEIESDLIRRIYQIPPHNPLHKRQRLELENGW